LQTNPLAGSQHFEVDPRMVCGLHVTEYSARRLKMGPMLSIPFQPSNQKVVTGRDQWFYKKNEIKRKVIVKICILISTPVGLSSGWPPCGAGAEIQNSAFLKFCPTSHRIYMPNAIDIGLTVSQP